MYLTSGETKSSAVLAQELGRSAFLNSILSITRWKKLRWILLRGSLGLILLVSVFLGLAFLPGGIEGNYRGIASSCGCDGITFLNLREGKMITYLTAHPPASLDGRYVIKNNGEVDVYLKGLLAEEKLIMKAYPRLLVTKFVTPENRDDGAWHWKWPSIGRIGESLRTQEVTLMIREKDGALNRKVFDHNLKFVRDEIRKSPRQSAEIIQSESDGLSN